LKGTINYGIKFTNNNKLNVYVVSDFAGDTETRRSTTGFLFSIGDALIIWYSKLQHCVATSTAEAEYYTQRMRKTCSLVYERGKRIEYIY